MKKSFLLIFLLIVASLNVYAEEPETKPEEAVADVYGKLKYSNTINWEDCYEYKVKFGKGKCEIKKRGIKIKIPSPSLDFEVMDVIAIVELVPDPWRSFFYNESLYDFEGKAKTGMADAIGAKPVLGKGYSNKNTADESIGVQKMDSHVWAVSDWWRLKSAGFKDGCFSLTCKNEDITGCIRTLTNTFVRITEGFKETIASINSGDVVPGQGQGVVNGETNAVSYEDGSVYTPDGDGGFTLSEEPGNWGVAGEYGASMAEFGNSDSLVPGYSNAELLMEGAAFASNPQGYVMDKATGYVKAEVLPGLKQEWNQSDLGKSVNSAVEGAKDYADGVANNISDAWNQSDIRKSASNAWEDAKDYGNQALDAGKNFTQAINESFTSATQMASEGASTVSNGFSNAVSSIKNAIPPILPASTKRGEQGPQEIEAYAGGVTGNSIETGNSIMEHSFGVNNENNKIASQNMRDNIPGADSQNLGSMALQMAGKFIDRIIYFNVIEQVIQMVAVYTPIMLHPVFMTERHKKASQTGGFFWSPMFKKFADLGAGLVMPVFCMTKVMGMGLDGVANIFGIDIPSNVLGGASKYISSRCVGSWGPLEPRVNIFGTGDQFVAAGLASVRALNIAQNITGDFYNKTINNSPYNSLEFNLSWPHMSSCYGFTGFKGLSRGWTTPLGGLLDNVSDKIKSGDVSGLLYTGATDVAENATKQGGFAFTYWKRRKCKLMLFCGQWKGDTGL